MGLSAFLKPRVSITFTYVVALVVFLVVQGLDGLLPPSGGALAWSLLPPGLALGDPVLSELVVRWVLVPCWVLHFLRRTADSGWVARYERPRPVIDALGAPVYYGLFAGWVGWSLRPEAFTAPVLPLVALGLALFVVGEVGNLISHLMLRRLRRPGEEGHPIPRGFLFELVSCPHYLCELVTWVGFALMTWTLATVVFAAVSLATMLPRALAAHARYRREFDGEQGRELYPGARRALIPFLF